MRRFVVCMAACLLLSLSSRMGAGLAAEEPWRGVDEAVVEKYAAENGRPACCPLINVEGDALLFAFLMAGVAGGFAMGYFYRRFTADGGKGQSADADKTEDGRAC